MASSHAEAEVKDIATEEELFEAAVEIDDPEYRSRFLEDACQGDGVLQKRIIRLINNARDADKFFDISDLVWVPEQATPENNATPADERRIGRYRLMEKIGSGGEGVVYAALQEEPVRREVAIKLMKAGRHGKEALDRFLAERQTLAIMEHPAIAKVFDAGTTDEGTPYFVMELVRGVRITEFLNQNRISIRDRIEMFLQVCNAVQHAHQKSITHRDLKPSNILVMRDDGTLIPKIIDFGIAKAVEIDKVQGPSEGLMFSFAGTPAYMSPEQISGSPDIDTRTDIYSLGVVLYELLVGQPPFTKSHFSRLTYAETRDLICNRPPLPPSQYFSELEDSIQSEVAAERSTKRSGLRHVLRGDVDEIVLKCLEKNRDDRYETAKDLAEDLRRFLRDEPVIARVPTPSYRFQKFVSRNKLAVIAATAVVTALVLGIVVSTKALIKERAARHDAQDANLRERSQRLRAEAGELTARRFSYVSFINSAQQSFENNNRGRARELLTRCIPDQGQIDLRGWEWTYLWKITRNDALATIAQQDSSIFSAGFLFDGRIITRDGQLHLKVRELDGSETFSLKADGYGRAIAIDPTGRFTAFSDFQGVRKVKLLDWKDRTTVAEFPSSDRVMSLDISPDRQLLAGICEDQTIRVWDLTRTGIVTTFHTSQLDGWHKGIVSFAPSGDLIAFGQTDGKVLIVESKTFRERTNFVASNEGITAMAFAQDGSTLATGSGFANTTIKLWNLRTGGLPKILRGHDSWVSSLAFFPLGDKLASGSGDQTIRIWNTETWDQSSVLRGNSDEVYTIAFSRDGKRLVSGSKSGEIMLWDPNLVRGADSFSKFPKRISKFQFLPNRLEFLALRRDRKLVISAPNAPWNDEEIGGIESDAEIAVSPDSALAAVADQIGKVTLWDLRTKKVVKDFEIMAGAPILLQFAVKEPDMLVALDAAHRLTVWSTNAWNQTASWQGNTNVNTAKLSPDGTLLAAGLNNGILMLLDAITGRLIRSEKAHSRVITSIDFSADGTRIATGSEDALIKVWRTSDLNMESTLRGHVLAVQSVAFSQDGSRLVSGSFDKQAIKVWDLITRQELITLKGSGSFFHGTMFSEDGTTLASVNSDGILHIWQGDSR
jgi:WD40 repeat protein/serine/threonine protein kinase